MAFSSHSSPPPLPPSFSLNGQAFPCHTGRRKKEREARKVKYNAETVVMNSWSQMEGDLNRPLPKRDKKQTLPESVATLPPFGPIEGQKWFDQISSQWESQKNRLALIYLGKIQFLPPLHLKYPVRVVPPLISEDSRQTGFETSYVTPYSAISGAMHEAFYQKTILDLRWNTRQWASQPK